MSALVIPIEELNAEQKFESTLLELVHAISESADSEDEIMAAVMHMLESGQVRLRGNFSAAHLLPAD